MGSFDNDNAGKLADSLHKAMIGNSEAARQEFQAANKLLTEATSTTHGDKNAQKQVINTVNSKLATDGFHIEGYGHNGDKSYILMRALNHGSKQNASDLYYCPISPDGKINMQKVQKDSQGQIVFPGPTLPEAPKKEADKDNLDRYNYNQNKPAPLEHTKQAADATPERPRPSVRLA